MIVATAGHVDHGKTSLLKHLTGVDTDRLPEEKKRGLTIDLGFAYTDSLRPGETTGFVDVPGHEKFIRNMLAGVTAIDAALLVVAADDGPMPQTREHLAILDLVGVRTGIVAVTKSDLVEVGRLDTVIAATRALIEPTGLADAPVVPVSSATGAGIDRLRQAIRSVRPAPKPAGGGFRMAIDRSFIVAGAGLVVTGLAQSGTLKAGDRLAVSPAGPKGIEARVARPEGTGWAGCAGPGRRPLRRQSGRPRRGAGPRSAGASGWSRRICSRSAGGSTSTCDCSLPKIVRCATGLRSMSMSGRPTSPAGLHCWSRQNWRPTAGLWRNWCWTAVCASAAATPSSCADQSAQRTLGGGRVLDCDGPRRGRATPQRLSLVKAQRRDSHAEALAAQLETAAGGVDLVAFARNRNITGAELAGLEAPGLVRTGAASRPAAVLERHLAGLADALRSILSGLAEGQGGSSGLPVSALPRMLPGRPLAAVADAALDRLIRDGIAERRGDRIVLAGRQIELELRDARLWSRIEPALQASGRPRTVWEVSEALGIAQQEVARFFKRAQAAGLVTQVSRNRFMTPAALAALAATAETGLAASGGDRFAVAEFRDWSGLGRNLSIEMLEYFDRGRLHPPRRQRTHHPPARRRGVCRSPRRDVMQTFPNASEPC